jgi:hypothetical protein
MKHKDRSASQCKPHEFSPSYSMVQDLAFRTLDQNEKLKSELQKLHTDYTHVIREKDKIIERQEERIARLEEALQAIAECKDKTLLGCNHAEADAYHGINGDCCKSHEIGANKAFNQCAVTAENALSRPGTNEKA